MGLLLFSVRMQVRMRIEETVSLGSRRRPWSHGSMTPASPPVTIDTGSAARSCSFIFFRFGQLLAALPGASCGSARFEHAHRDATTFVAKVLMSCLRCENKQLLVYSQFSVHFFQSTWYTLLSLLLNHLKDINKY